MKVALIGATGNAGSRVLAELVKRGHQVTAIARTPEKVAKLKGVTAVKGDLDKSDLLPKAMAGHDAVISSVKFKTYNTQALVDAVRKSGVKRYLVVGGAGSLIMPSGQMLMETPEFPEAVKPEAQAGGRLLDQLKATKDLDWTFISPSMIFQPGQRTGKYRTGKDHLLFPEKGPSTISMEDFAIAMVDELEKPKHSKERFTVGY